VRIHRNNLAVLLATGIVVTAMDAGPLVAIASMDAAPPAVAIPATFPPPAPSPSTRVDSNQPGIETVNFVEGAAR
jgi:hypothetical protein